MIVGDLNVPLLPTVRSSKQKLNKEMLELNDVIKQRDLTITYRTFQPNMKEYTFLSVPHGTVSKTDHILRHKTSLSRYKKTEITLCILSDHHGLNRDMNKTTESLHSWKLNNSLLNKRGKKWVKKKIKTF